ncbi:MAG TPA: Bax inhibitor-1 family protein [Solirubrobacteraceae bacterium]|jgi:modulator of FtsH protease|nr:Bax inhibitor-1 family protein [Solirubrobacteraceae bacterium]
MSFSRQYALRDQALTRDQTRGVFGQVMGLVALTFGCLALGAYITRNLTGGTGILFLILGFACFIGLQAATKRGHEQLAVGLLFGLGLSFGMALGPLLAYYAHANSGAVYQAAGSTALFTGGLGAAGYATRRDLSSWSRTLFRALVVLIVFGLITLFVAIPGANVIYAVFGLIVFGALTVFDFNRLRRTTMGGAVPIAASIFLDILNVFLFFLQLFGGGNRR